MRKPAGKLWVTHTQSWSCCSASWYKHLPLSEDNVIQCVQNLDSRSTTEIRDTLYTSWHDKYLETKRASEDSQNGVSRWLTLAWAGEGRRLTGASLLLPNQLPPSSRSLPPSQSVLLAHTRAFLYFGLLLPFAFQSLDSLLAKAEILRSG